MKKSLPCFTLLAAITLAKMAWASGPESVAGVPNSAQPAVAETNGTSTPDPYSNSPLQPVVKSNPDETPVGDRLLTQATAQLERRASVTARMRHQIDIAGKQLYGVGNYWQQGSGEALKVRLE